MADIMTDPDITRALAEGVFWVFWALVSFGVAWAVYNWVNR